MKTVVVLASAAIVTSGCASWVEKPEGPATAAVVAGASVVSHYADVCRHYPCAHLGHLGLGALVGYTGTKHYDEPTAWKWGAIFAVGKEVFDLMVGKPFGLFDAVQRLAGTGIGVFIAKGEAEGWKPVCNQNDARREYVATPECQ